MQLPERSLKSEFCTDLQLRPVTVDAGQCAVMQCQCAIDLRCVEDVDQGQLGMGTVRWQDILDQYKPAQAAFEVRAGGDGRQCVGMPLPVK